MLTAWEAVMLKRWTCNTNFWEAEKEKTNTVLIAVVRRFGTRQNRDVRANNENMHLQLFSDVN